MAFLMAMRHFRRYSMLGCEEEKTLVADSAIFHEHLYVHYGQTKYQNPSLRGV